MTVDHHIIGLFRTLQEIQTNEFPKNFLIVTLSERQYGIETHRISELISVNKVWLFPESTTVIKGVLNWYGDRIPVLDIRTWFGGPARQYDDSSHIVVVMMDRQYIGLIVDRVNKVATLGGRRYMPQQWTTDQPSSPHTTENSAGVRQIG